MPIINTIDIRKSEVHTFSYTDSWVTFHLGHPFVITKVKIDKEMIRLLCDMMGWKVEKGEK